MRWRALLLLAAGFALADASAEAAEADLHRFDPGGRVEAARAVDLDRDGTRDLVLRVTRFDGERGERPELLLVRVAAETTAEEFWERAHLKRIALDEGPARTAGAFAVGRFGPAGETRIRLFTADGIHDLDVGGTPLPQEERWKVPTLLSRSAGRRIGFWDGHADLDGDGIEECWFPDGEGSGRVRLLGGTPALDRRLSLDVFNRGATDDEFLFLRYARVPRMVPADLEGDERKELIAWDGGALVAWSLDGGEAPSRRIPLPFARTELGPDEVYTPRLQLADVDGDGFTDLLVTIVTGDRTQIESFRTRLYHYPGPFFDAERGRLVAPASRIDTESVALHPRFVDLDGDGALDYVCDSITGTKKDLILRVLGQEPTIWYVAYRFDTEAGTFEKEPTFRVERPYSREEAVSNRFGISAYFEGDFDGDGLKDLLDLGNLNGMEILGAFQKGGDGAGDPITFTKRLLARMRVEKPLTPDALIADFDGNGLVDAAVWNEEGLWLAMFRRSP